MVRRLVPTERNCASNILRMLTERNRFRKALTPTRKDWKESRNAEGDSRINAYEDSRINAYEHSRINAYECACDYFSGTQKKSCESGKKGRRNVAFREDAISGLGILADLSRPCHPHRS
jgi:hypothetical protein